MSLPEALLILVAGFAAGTINAIVGSGTLITFPALLVLGYPPLVANVSNNVGLVAGGLGSIRGYREELAGQGATLRKLLPASVVGATTGALLLFVLPEDAFEAIVPVLIALAIALVLAGPRLQKRFAQRAPAAGAAGAAGAQPVALRGSRAAGSAGAQPVALSGSRTAGSDAVGSTAGETSPGRLRLAVAGVGLAGVYGGYFGAAQGVLLIGLMSVLLTEPLQRLNGFKNVLGTAVNAVAAIVFILVAFDTIDWSVAGLIALGALGGGYAGAHIGRRLPPNVLRGAIVVIGTIAIARLLFFD